MSSAPRLPGRGAQRLGSLFFRTVPHFLPVSLPGEAKAGGGEGSGLPAGDSDSVCAVISHFSHLHYGLSYPSHCRMERATLTNLFFIFKTF